jgi:predicted kinase
VLDVARPFATPHTRRIWIESEPGARDPDLPAYDDTACEVTLMAGLPASGKDTWLRANRPDLPVISLDRLRGELDVDPDDPQSEVIAAAREQARRYLRAGTSFAWNATNLTPSLRGQLLELFRGYRARTHIVYCEAGPDDLLTRNRSREARVPGSVIDRMLGRWTVPDPTEAHEVTYAIPQAPGGVAWPPTLQNRADVKPPSNGS